MEITPNGKSIGQESFVTKLAQQIIQQNIQSDFKASPTPTNEYSFDGYRISGFENHFGPTQRYIRPQDVTTAFQIVLGG